MGARDALRLSLRNKTESKCIREELAARARTTLETDDRESRLTFEEGLVLSGVEREFLAPRDVICINAVRVHRRSFAIVIGLGRLLRAPLDFKLGDKETVHVVHVWIDPPREVELVREDLAAVAREAGHTEPEFSVDEANVGPLAERVVHNGLVFVDHDGAGRVDEIPTRLRVCLDTVDRAQDELLLKVSEEREVAFGLLQKMKHRTSALWRQIYVTRTYFARLHFSIFSDDARSTAWRVKEHPVETADDLGKLAAIV